MNLMNFWDHVRSSDLINCPTDSIVNPINLNQSMDNAFNPAFDPINVL